jgi:hypothetical protein
MTAEDRVQWVVRDLEQAKRIAEEQGVKVIEVLVAMAIDQLHMLEQTIKEEGTETRSQR